MTDPTTFDDQSHPQTDAERLSEIIASELDRLATHGAPGELPPSYVAIFGEDGEGNRSGMRLLADVSELSEEVAGEEPLLDRLAEKCVEEWFFPHAVLFAGLAEEFRAIPEVQADPEESIVALEARSETPVSESFFIIAVSHGCYGLKARVPSAVTKGSPELDFSSTEISAVELISEDEERVASFLGLPRFFLGYQERLRAKKGSV